MALNWANGGCSWSVDASHWVLLGATVNDGCELNCSNLTHSHHTKSILCSNLHVVTRALNGANGECTGSDDVSFWALLAAAFAVMRHRVDRRYDQTEEDILIIGGQIIFFSIMFPTLVPEIVDSSLTVGVWGFFWVWAAKLTYRRFRLHWFLILFVIGLHICKSQLNGNNGECTGDDDMGPKQTFKSAGNSHTVNKGANKRGSSSKGGSAPLRPMDCSKPICLDNDCKYYHKDRVPCRKGKECKDPKCPYMHNVCGDVQKPPDAPKDEINLATEVKIIYSKPEFSYFRYFLRSSILMFRWLIFLFIGAVCREEARFYWEEQFDAVVMALPLLLSFKRNGMQWYFTDPHWVPLMNGRNEGDHADYINRVIGDELGDDAVARHPFIYQPVLLPTTTNLYKLDVVDASRYTHMWHAVVYPDLILRLRRDCTQERVTDITAATLHRFACRKWSGANQQIVLNSIQAYLNEVELTATTFTALGFTGAKGVGVT